MSRIPITTPGVGLGGTVAPYAQDRVGGAGGRTLEGFGNEAEEFLTQIADQDAAVEGLSRLADFKISQAQRLDALQQSAASPEGFTPTALKDFDDQSKEFLKGLGNPRVSRFVEMRMPEVRGATAASALQWETNARGQLRQQNFLDGLNKYQTLATQSLGNYEAAKADTMALLNAGGFDPVEAAKLQTLSVRSLAKSAVFGEIGRNPQSMLERLNKGDFPELDADTRLQAIGAAESKIREVTADERLANATRRTRVAEWVKDDMASVVNTGQSVPLPEGYTEADLAEVFNPAELAALRQSQIQARELYKATSDIGTQPLAQAAATIQKLKPVEGQQGYQDKLQIYQQAQEKFRNMLALRATDPAQAVRQSFPALQRTWAQFEKSQDAKSLQAAVTATLAAQDTLGIPAAAQRPLPLAVAKNVATSITTARPEDAYKELRKWKDLFGPQWGRAVRQVGAQLPPAYKVAATMDDPTDAALLIQSSRMKVEDLRKAAGVTDRAMRDEIAADQSLRKLALSFGMGGSQLAAEHMEAVETLALGRMATLGDTDAVNNAVRSIVEDKYEFGEMNGRPFVVTGERYRGRVGEIESAAQYAADVAAQAAGIKVPPAQPGMTPEAAAEQYRNAVRRKSYWVTNPGGGGVTLFSEKNVPVEVGGKPVSYTWDELFRLQASRPVPPKPRTDREIREQELGIKGGKGGPIGSPQELKFRAENPADFARATGQQAAESVISAPDAELEETYKPTSDVVSAAPTGTPDPLRETLAEAGRRGADFGRAGVPKWLQDLEDKRRQLDYGASGINRVPIGDVRKNVERKHNAEIKRLQDAYWGASEKDRARLAATPVYVALKENGMLGSKSKK